MPYSARWIGLLAFALSSGSADARAGEPPDVAARCASSGAWGSTLAPDLPFVAYQNVDPAERRRVMLLNIVTWSSNNWQIDRDDFAAILKANPDPRGQLAAIARLKAAHFRESIRQYPTYGADIEQAFNRAEQGLVEASDFRMGLSPKNAVRAIQALAVSELRCVECAAAVRDALRIGEPRNQLRDGAFMGQISFLPLVRRVLTEPRYRKMILETAAKAMDRVARSEGGERDEGGDVFSALLEAGGAESPEVARAMAMDVMGVYGTQGPSMQLLYSFVRYANLAPIVALNAIAHAMAYLDVHRPAGRSYSFPTSIRSACPFGRPYHFWMGALLARELVALGHAPRTAALTTYLLGNLYEFASPSLGRGLEAIDQVARADTVDHPRFDAMRFSTAFRTAGAVFGATFGTNAGPAEYAVDRSIVEMTLAAKRSGAAGLLRSLDRLRVPRKNLGVGHYPDFHRLIRPDLAWKILAAPTLGD